MMQTLDLGSAGIDNMLQMLKPAGSGDDVAVRFALTSLARYSSQKGMEAKWKLVQESFLKAIENTRDTEIKKYLIRQLYYGANDDAAEPLRKYLKDEQLADPVTQLFVYVKSAKSEQALKEALNVSSDASRAVFVKALGELRSSSSVGAISKLAGSGNKELERTVLSALANIGDPGSYNLLWNAALKASFNYEPTEATASFLKYTNQLGAAKETKLCKQACLNLIKATRENHLLPTQAAAIQVFSRYFPVEAGNLILKSADSRDSSYRMALLNTAKNLDDASYTQKWIKKAKTSTPETKADIIHMLGERNDKAALSFVKESLQDKASRVRKSAIWALVKLDTDAAEKELLPYLAKGNEVAESETALKTLLNEKKLDQVASQLSSASPSGKAGLINLIAAKSGSRYFDQIYAFTSNDDALIRTSAIAALKRISTYNSIPGLLKLLAGTSDAATIKEIQQALINAALANEDAEQAAEPLLRELQASQQKEKLIPVLPAIGGTRALKEVASLFGTNNGNVKQAAFNALVNWRNTSASPHLFTIVQSENSEFRNEAFRGYVNQVRRSNWADDQKLLKLQMIMAHAQSADEKRMVINALGRVKTFLSLVYVGKYLDDPSVQQAASYAAAQIALPETDSKQGFYGDIPRSIIQKTIRVMSGAESEYVKESLKRYLESMPQDPGFVSMFNGTDLSGWKGFVTNPIKLAAMNPKEREKLQKKANEKLHFNWKVQDGMIVFNGDGDNLLSDKEYSDFEMIVNWKISRKGDSGIYLRGTPQVQIWDTSRTDVGAQVGSGGLYNNQKHPSKPLKVADNPIEEWNTFRIIMLGEKVTVFLNGELVVDQVTLENFWDRNLPIFPSGTIELQAHGTDLAFKDIYVREIKNTESGLSPEEKTEGFASLFNGANLDGWIGNKKDYKAESGNIVIKPTEGEGGGNLFTEKEYGDFIFRFEFQLTPGANNGLGVRAPLEGDAAYTGMELQILDNTAAIYADLKPYQYHGSVYGVIPAKREFLKPVGEWNSQEVYMKGSKIRITLNGTVIVDGDLKEASKNGTIDGKEHPGLLRDKGHIGFLGHGSLVKFRNIRIKEI
jgi:HEAT repeat protein